VLFRSTTTVTPTKTVTPTRTPTNTVTPSPTPTTPPPVNGSLLFTSGSTNYISTPNTSGFQFGTGNFTVEMWVNLSDNSNAGLISNGLTGSGGAWMMEIVGSRIYWQSSGIANNINSATLPQLNTWQHIAFVRIGTTLSYYLQGNLVTNTTVSTNYNYTLNTLTVGKSYENRYTSGNISNVRITKGVGVYTGNFTVPTSPLQATQSSGVNISAITGVQTSLLLNTYTGVNYIKDNSTFNNTMTNINGVSSNGLTPF
jgi:hypothetical protein